MHRGRIPDRTATGECTIAFAVVVSTPAAVDVGPRHFCEKGSLPASVVCLGVFRILALWPATASRRFSRTSTWRDGMAAPSLRCAAVGGAVVTEPEAGGHAQSRAELPASALP